MAADATYPRDRAHHRQNGDFAVPSGAIVDFETGAELRFAGTNRRAAIEEAFVTQSLTAATTVAADVLAIPVTHEVVGKTTGADAEALTLANGSPGQVLQIRLDVDGGGDGTLTPTTKTGFASIVFADAGDTVTLKFIDATVGWVILAAFGASAQPAINLS